MASVNIDIGKSSDVTELPVYIVSINNLNDFITIAKLENNCIQVENIKETYVMTNNKSFRRLLIKTHNRRFGYTELANSSLHEKK